MNTISLNILAKMTSQKEGGGLKQMLTGLTKGGRGVGEMLTMADIICEQPLNGNLF